MPIDNAFATHPGKAAEASEKKNEDFAHAWVRTRSAIRSPPTATVGVTSSTLPHLWSMRSNALLKAIRSRE